MNIREWLNKDEWKNITPYLFCCMSNMKDGVEWQISVSVYSDTEDKKMLLGAKPIATITGDGIELTKNHKQFCLRLIKLEVDDAPDYLQTNKGFMILARLRKNLD